MRITEAAQRLGTSPRMLRYRDLLGLLPPVREPPAAARRGRIRAAGWAADRASAERAAAERAGPEWAGAERASARQAGTRQAGTRPAGTRPAGAWEAGAGRAGRHRQFGEDDLVAVSLALEIEQRYDISPAALAFGLRVLTEPGVRAEVAELARRIGRIRPLPARALEFEKERALRLLNLAPGRTPPTRAGESRRSAHRSTRP
jgi:MerR family transcriptional regulator, copper efflux regulator